MKKILPALLPCVLLLLNASPAGAQPAGEAKRLRDASNAYSFTAPRGFNARQTDEGFALSDATESVVIAVKIHDFQTFAQFSAQSDIKEDGFTPMGKVVDFGERGKIFRVSKRGAQGLLIVDTFVLFSPFGGGALVVAFSEYADREKAFNAAWALAESMTFARPQATEVGNQWETYLRGKHLLYFYTSGGYSERRDIHLCPSGEFISRNDATSNSASGTGALRGGSDGRWRVAARGGPTLILQFRSGGVSEYKISRGQAGNEIGLDGNRYFVRASEACPAR